MMTMMKETNSRQDSSTMRSRGWTARRPTTACRRSCLKNLFMVVLIFIYLLLTGVAFFLAYQTISDFLEKLNHPVMSVTYKEVDSFSPPGIALYPGRAELLSCRHHFHDYIPPLVEPGTHQEGECRKAVVVRGPSDVRNKELIFMQFSLNETEEDFSAINYMLFSKFSDLTERTWVKMSLVRTSGKSNEAVEFRQESAVVKFNDKRPDSEKNNQLFFAVFQWRDAFMQDIRLVTANFAKLTIQWIIKMRKRHLRNKARELNQI
ncbi:hypothetical protein F7725_008582, partial [Dissostichus mawsoni]